MKNILLFSLLFASTASAQHNLAAFSIWKPKEGQAARFEAGYKKHLQWHIGAGDKWNWYGWFIISGDRAGQFVDATFGHEWRDLDHRVDPAGDGADNDLHTDPFADYLTGYKLQRLPFSDAEDSITLGARYLRMLTIDVTNPHAAAALVESLATGLRQQSHPFLAYEMADGGRLGQLILLIGARDFADYGLIAAWQGQLLDLDHRSAKPVITAITAETLVFRRDMSINL
ncbi:hypothetical protein [Puia dinghuensis]|uniref:Uncharacterized protein n=1 Tax=Puia dinghuensis TaxID=1792502 RepID=A0A8J2XUD9_9BACT|nr:hypothetical protein [Puia dinghuensis]GGB25024.1 hypothetical protein GCM10011511_56210 [Puia dinghuensis]